MLKFFRPKSKAISKIVSETASVAAAAKASPANYIHCSAGEPAVITTYIQDRPLAWIEFDRDQLEDLIVILQRRRAQMDR